MLLLVEGLRHARWVLKGSFTRRSRGATVTDVIIFGIGNDWLARAACNAILIQGVGQYLVNLNIWTHNILTLLARSRVCLSQPCQTCHLGSLGSAAALTTYFLIDHCIVCALVRQHHRSTAAAHIQEVPAAHQ